MAEIIIAGAGHGGLVAAAKLAKAGHHVAVYEKQSEGHFHLNQIDAFDAEAMKYAEIDIPEHWFAENNIITFVPLDDDAPSLTLPAVENAVTLKVERKELYDFLCGLAKKEGAEFFYDTEILAPIVLGNRIAGIDTNKGKFYADLIIDACGIYSPLRSQMPAFTNIEHDPSEYDVLHTYRAYFGNIKDAERPETDYNLYLKDDGTVGLSWLVTEEECTDALVARFHETSFQEIANVLHSLSVDNPQMGTNLIRGGYIVDIPVRQPLSVLVADGYAVIGDAAFMTYAAKGSGIAYSIKAGAMLAKAVELDTNNFFTAETLWEYEKTFFKEIGFSACRIAIGKNVLPYLTAQELSDAFKEKLITTEELQMFMSGSFESKTKGELLSMLKGKIQLLNSMPEFRAKLASILGWIGKFTIMEPTFPNKYSPEDVSKWAEKYNSFFNSIRYTGELIQQ